MLLAIIVGLAVGAVVGASSSFLKLFVQLALYGGVRKVLTDLPVNPTAGEMLRVNLAAYVVWCSAILIVLLTVRGLKPALLFYFGLFGAFFVAFPVPAIWLTSAWLPHG